MPQALASALSNAALDGKQSGGGSNVDQAEEVVADDEIFWMDSEGTISVPAAANEGGIDAALLDGSARRLPTQRDVLPGERREMPSPIVDPRTLLAHS